MKTVKILSMALLMSVFCVGMTFAQQQQPTRRSQQKEQTVATTKPAKATKATKATAEERASKQVAAMKKSLNLSNDQVNKLQNVQTQYIKDQDQARTSKKGNQQDWKAKKDAYDSQVKSILTPAQYQQWQAQHPSKKSPAKPGQAPHHPSGKKVQNDPKK